MSLISRLHTNSYTPALEAIQREQNSTAESAVSGGFMSGFGSTFASLAKPDTWSTLLDTLGDATNNIMQLMAVFVLRTLILPLLFLYCLGIGFKAIWRVDARDLMRRYIRDGKGVLNRPGFRGGFNS